MSWYKNCALFAVGGLAGLTLAAVLEENLEACREKNADEPGGLEILAEEIRREAKWAMEECTSEEDRKKVYEQVRHLVRSYQAELRKIGEEIIVMLQRDAADAQNREEVKEAIDSRVREFKLKTDGFD